MKKLCYAALVCLAGICGCTKNAGIITGGGWQLVEKSSSFGYVYAVNSAPAADSSVLLVLNNDSTYATKLNGQVVSSGSYSVAVDTSYNNTPVLQLNNFTTTGIFSVLTLTEVGANGQAISSYNGMFMHASNDTLTLSTIFTPAGYTKYTFVKRP